MNSEQEYFVSLVERLRQMPKETYAVCLKEKDEAIGSIGLMAGAAGKLNLPDMEGDILMEYTHFVSVAALVFNEAGEVLLIKSPNRGWEYPGGMVEPGESLEAALHREIREETGVDIVVKSFAGICKNIQRDVVNIDFICEYARGDIITSEESLEVKWVSKKDARNMVTFPLTKIRLENMLEQTGKMYCFAFRREPFEVVEGNWFEV